MGSTCVNVIAYSQRPLNELHTYLAMQEASGRRNRKICLAFRHGTSSPSIKVLSSPRGVTSSDLYIMESGRDAIRVVGIVIVGTTTRVDIAEIRIIAVPVIRRTLPPNAGRATKN